MVTGSGKLPSSESQSISRDPYRNIDPSTVLYSKPNGYSEPVRLLGKGEIVYMGNVVKGEDGTKFVAILTLDNKSGYILGDSKLHELQILETIAKKTYLYSTTSTTTQPVFSVNKGTRLILLETVRVKSIKWLLLSDATGREGYIEDNLSVLCDPADVPTGMKMIQLGGGLFGGGIILSILGRQIAAAVGGGSYVVFTGLILFGLFRLITGIIYYSAHLRKPPVQSVLKAYVNKARIRFTLETAWSLLSKVSF